MALYNGLGHLENGFDRSMELLDKWQRASEIVDGRQWMIGAWSDRIYKVQLHWTLANGEGNHLQVLNHSIKEAVDVAIAQFHLYWEVYIQQTRPNPNPPKEQPK